MKHLILFILLSFSMASIASIRGEKANKDTERFRYEIECAGNGVQGTSLVKVWTYSKSAKIAERQAMKNAVHGIIFKGFASTKPGCVSQRPLVTKVGAEEEFSDFFNLFFDDNGDFRKYVSVTGGREVTRVGKEYKIGVIVSVSKDQLRKALEEAGVIKKLSSGF